MKPPSKKQFISLLSIICCFTANSQNTEKAVWWKETVFYQIYMPSYADSDGNGYGDFNGMTDKLDYLKSLGIKGIWLTPFLKSPKVDNGYDVADYYAVDTVYGTLLDFKTFLNEAHKRDIRVIMDMVLNHTSTDCKWFLEAKKSKDNPYRDYYIWKDKPNNWESFFGGSAWEYDINSKQYYYHKFDITMADLNWQNPKVVEEVKNILRFWLEMGVDGFRLDVINFLTTDGVLQDNPVVNEKQQHVYDIDQAGVKHAMQGIKQVVAEYQNRFIVGEIGSDKLEFLKQYQSEELLDVVFNFNFGSIPSFSDEKIVSELKKMDQEMEGYPTLFFGSHDMPRMLDRLANGNIKRAEALAAVILTAKGIPFIYYGEEIGMQNIVAEQYNEIVDIQAKTQYKLAIADGKTAEEAILVANNSNRDKSRSPMQWDTTQFAGFSSSKPWIKISDNYKQQNVEVLKKDENSIYEVYKELINLKNKYKVLQYGNYKDLTVENNIVTFVRSLNNEFITTIINFGKPTKIQLPKDSKILMGNSNLNQNEFVIYYIAHQ